MMEFLTNCACKILFRPSIIMSEGQSADTNTPSNIINDNNNNDNNNNDNNNNNNNNSCDNAAKPNHPENGHVHIGRDESVGENMRETAVYLHTGNIANWSNLKSRKSHDIPSHELHQSFARTLEKGVQERGTLLANKEAYMGKCFEANQMDENERGLLKVTVKIFLQVINSIKE